MSIGDRRTILLVEDEAIIAMAEKASLQGYGYTVVTAPSGEKALEALRENTAVDLILMDIDLGRGMDGTETARAILKERTIPVVFLSSHVEPEVVAKTEKITSYGYVVKDSGPIVLNASIKMAFKLFEATDKLAKEKERLRTTLNSIGDAVIATDLYGKVTGMNPVAELLTGWTSDDALGKPIGSVFDIVDAGTRLPVENPVKQVLAGGAVVALADQTVLISKSALEHRIADSGAPIRSADGAATGVVLVFRDVSREYEMQEELRRQNAFMTTVLENAPIGFAVNTIDDGRTVFVSSKFLQIYGVDRQAANSVEEFFAKVYPDPIFRENIRTRILADMASGDAARMRWENIPLDDGPGEKKVVTAINIPVLEQNLMVSTVQDVTERWTAEEKLRLSHERLRRFVDANIIGIVIAAADGKIIETNDYYLNLIGYTRGEFEAGSIDWRAITPPEWLPAYEKSIRELHEKGACTPYEKEYQLRDGSRVSIFITNTLLPGPEEHIAAFVLDITERKRAEKKIGPA